MSRRRCSAALLVAALLDCGAASGFERAERKTGEGVATSASGSQALENRGDRRKEGSKVIPDWKLDLLVDDGKDWWSKFGRFGVAVGEGFRQALWGNGWPQITSSPAQDHQRCPVIKLPADFNIVAKSRSWTSLDGDFSTSTGITLATWEQNFLGMAFSRDVKHMSVSYKQVSTGRVAFRSRIFTDQEMLTLYGWKAPPLMMGNVTMEEDPNTNIAIVDCVGSLMYVLKQETEYEQNAISLYSRDGSIVAKTRVESPILRYQWIDPKTKYLIGTAEAPGYHANITERSIPSYAEVGHVMPFGFHYETGGYPNASAFMESEFRWVLATAIQALALSKAEHRYTPWTAVTLVEVGMIALLVLAVLAVVGLAYCIFRLVYPPEYVLDKNYHGKIADNPFLAVPPCPPHREDNKAKINDSRQYAQDIGLHGRSYGTYNRV